MKRLALLGILAIACTSAPASSPPATPKAPPPTIPTPPATPTPTHTTSQALLATLPTGAAGITFDASRVIDDSLMSGYASDDVLAALGKRREDATVVVRYSSEGDVGIGALVVDGVAGDLLLDTFVRTWEEPAAIARTEATIDGRDIWAIETRGGYFTMAYQSGAIVYWANASDRALTEQLVAAMP